MTNYIISLVHSKKKNNFNAFTISKMASHRPKITPNLSQIKTVAAWPFYHKVLDTTRTYKK